MFQHTLEQLAAGVHAALRCPDPDVMQLLRERHERALDLIEALPAPLAEAYYGRIRALLPPAWPRGEPRRWH